MTQYVKHTTRNMQCEPAPLVFPLRGTERFGAVEFHVEIEIDVVARWVRTVRNGPLAAGNRQCAEAVYPRPTSIRRSVLRPWLTDLSGAPGVHVRDIAGRIIRASKTSRGLITTRAAIRDVRALFTSPAGATQSRI